MSYQQNKLMYKKLEKIHGRGVRNLDDKGTNNLIAAHGSTLDTEFEVPEGYNFITFNLCGDSLDNIIGNITSQN